MIHSILLAYVGFVHFFPIAFWVLFLVGLQFFTAYMVSAYVGAYLLPQWNIAKNPIILLISLGLQLAVELATLYGFYLLMVALI